jgi:hypothetical protein
MKRINKKWAIVIALVTVTAVFAFAEDLLFNGWSTWGGIRAAVNRNTVTLNGKSNLSGYVNSRLPLTMRNRTVVLEIRNAGASVFEDGRLMKITVNDDDLLVVPDNVEYLIEDEYIPSYYELVEFTLPENFDGKIGFVFYRADLKGLQITAAYR